MSAFLRAACVAGFLGHAWASYGGTWAPLVPGENVGLIGREVESAVLTTGTLVRATNIGSLAGTPAAPVTISGIAFDNDDAVTGGSNAWNGTSVLGSADPASDLGNLLSTGLALAEWGPEVYAEMTFDVFVPGRDYRLQFFLAHEWEWAAVNMYGPEGGFAGDHAYNPSAAGTVTGPTVSAINYTFTATSTTHAWNIGPGAGHGAVELLAFTIFDVTASTSVPGDFTSDGVVDGEDLTHPTLGWITRFGDDLDGSDFLIWQRNLGSPSAAVAASVIPEPNAVTLSLLATIAAAYAARRRRE